MCNCFLLLGRGVETLATGNWLTPFSIAPCTYRSEIYNINMHELCYASAEYACGLQKTIYYRG